MGSAEVCTGECPCVGLGACPGTCGTHLFPLLIQWQVLPLRPQLMQSGGCEKVSASIKEKKLKVVFAILIAEGKRDLKHQEAEAA